MLVDSLARYRDQLGNNHRTVMASTYQLAICYFYQGRYDESKELLLEALRIARTIYDDTYPSVFQIFGQLGIVCDANGELIEAERYIKNALEHSLSKWGAEHPNTLQEKHNLAGIYLSLSKYNEAETLLREVLEARKLEACGTTRF